MISEQSVTKKLDQYISMKKNCSLYLDNSHTIEIEADGLLIRMSNEIKPLLLKMLMDTLKESLC